MTRIRLGAGTALLLALAACGGGEREETAASNAADYQARLQAMPEAQRNATFIRAIRDAEQECQGVESSSYQGEPNGRPTWLARCQGGSEWLIVIGADGGAMVINAGDARRAADQAQ